MKTMILILALSLGSLLCVAQVYSPYGNVGASISNDAVAYNAEAGVQKRAARYAFAASASSPTDNFRNLNWSIGPKAYFRFAGDNKLGIFAYGSALMDLHTGHALTFEPGVAGIFNIGGLSPQVHIGFPIREREVLRGRPLQVAAGLSLNF